ncbi:LacI family DNA-binding transcriptional regulator [Actinomadura luteofluorescens]|uniref:LacI family DNA-binding transcriptional regulator n=1 Tax=Actinomadura luteofluorescens TaxID=46163 RepID=UPI0021647839|nr:LacI family DNA-binding transcriptional regulator [Actinomadura glauciflava]MCR3743050.1 transcriptional regulator, LacI family [Actinomadura glauciflava]
MGGTGTGGGATGRGGASGPGGGPRASIRAVATLAGVSPSTVSRALNNPELVNAETRRRVLECAERLGYRPNRAAQSLVLGRTRNVGLIVPDIANPFFAPFIKGVEAYFRDTEYAVFLADTDEDTATEVRLAEAMVERVDGLILCAPRMTGARLRAVAARTAVVLANRTSGAAPSVLLDFRPGMEQAVAHVHALGHRRCAYLAGPANSWSNRQRRRFLGAACAERGIDLVDLGPYEPRFTGGYRAADEVLAAGVTAVFAYNDLVALGVLSRLAARGVPVPGELSIVGFDDVPMASMTNPPLTSVAMPVNALSRAAAATVHAMLDPRAPKAPPLPPATELATRLLIRGTTGPA